MKKILSLILAMTMLFTGFSVSFASNTANVGISTTTSGKCGKNVKWSYKNGTLTISGSGAMTDYKLLVDAPWFELSDKIHKIKICNGVTKIGKKAFSGTNVSNITISNSVTTIGSEAFYFCGELKTITIPAGTVNISSSAFIDSEISKISVDSSNKSYTSKDGVLYNKKKTTLLCYPPDKLGDSFTIPASVTRIGDYAFYGCNILNFSKLKLESIIIPKKITYIGKYAFADCNGITRIVFKGKQPKIGKHAFVTLNIEDGLKRQYIYFPPSWSKVLPATAVDNDPDAWMFGAEIKYVLDARTSLSDLRLFTEKTKKAALTWEKVSGVSGYEIQMSRNSSFSSPTKKTVKGTSATFSVSKGKKYYFRVRTYKTIGGKKYYSKWSTVKHKTI